MEGVPFLLGETSPVCPGAIIPPRPIVRVPPTRLSVLPNEVQVTNKQLGTQNTTYNAVSLFALNFHNGHRRPAAAFSPLLSESVYNNALVYSLYVPA